MFGAKTRKPTVRFGSGRFLRPPVPVPPVPVLTKKMKMLANPQKSKTVQKSIPNQKITSPHHPKSKNNIAPPRQKERGGPLGPQGAPTLSFWRGGAMLFFDFGWWGDVIFWFWMDFGIFFDFWVGDHFSTPYDANCLRICLMLN